MLSRKYQAAILMGLLGFLGNALFAEDAPSKDAAKTEPTPILAEIAKANEASWAAIKSLDLRHDFVQYIVKEGKRGREVRSTDLQWQKEGERERCRGIYHSAVFKNDDFDAQDIIRCIDCCVDGKTERIGPYLIPHQTKDDAEKHEHNKTRAEIRKRSSKLWGMQSGFPALLRYPHLGIGPRDEPLTLSDIIRTWKVEIKGKQTSKEGDTLWLLHAEYPPKNAGDEYAGSFLDITVNANKGFWVQKILSYINNLATDSKTNQRVGVYSSEEFSDFQDFGGVFFPKQLKRRYIGREKELAKDDGLYSLNTVTKLSVNAPLPKDAFDFHFPAGEPVWQLSDDYKTEKVFIWGPDDKPAQEFASDDEYRKFEAKDRIREFEKSVEEKRDSKKPEDVGERCMYYCFKKDFDKAIECMSQLIADDPKSEEAMDVRMFRGMIRVFCLKKDVEVGVADLTDYLDYYRGKKDKESSEAVDSASAMAYFVRGVYYAQQNDADKSLADLSEALREDLCLMEGEPGAHMLRGAIYLQKGDLEKAKADADAAIINNPPSSDAFLLRAAIFEKQGEKAKADADREQAKKIAKEGAENKWEDDDWTGEPIHTAIHSCLLKIVPTLEKR